MELKILSPSENDFLKHIEWNHEEIKNEIAKKVEVYEHMFYTDDELKFAKADRASLNKFVKALEEKRKEVKWQCLAPYNEFEKQINEIIAIVQKPIGLIDTQVKAFEEQRKAEKTEQILEYWNSIEHPEWIEYERIANAKWTNMSYSMSRIKNEITEILDRIAAEVTTINSMEEYSFEAFEDYKNHLDITHAISEGQRLADIQRRKAELEAARAEAETKETETAAEDLPEEKSEIVPDKTIPEQAENEAAVPPASEPKKWIGFKALLNYDEALALRDFFESRNIEFKPL